MLYEVITVNHFYQDGKKLRTYNLTKIKNPQEFHVAAADKVDQY